MKTLPVGLLVIGVTGGIGSGKSIVCAEFARLGFPVLFADEIGKDLSTNDPHVRKHLTRLLGPETYLPDGSYNRPYVASRIFSDASLKKRVEELIHPRVEQVLETRLRALRRAGEHVVLVEAALIFEAGYDRWLSAVLVVDTEERLRWERLRARGMAEDEIRRRMAGQLDPSLKAERADYLIKNNGSPEELINRVHFFATMFHTLAETRPA